MERLFEIDMGRDLRMVAERGIGGNWDREVCISIINKDGVYIQDLALIRNMYVLGYDDPEWIDDMFEVFVWANESSEDYTDGFVIPLRQEENE